MIFPRVMYEERENMSKMYGIYLFFGIFYHFV
jgi:hypothetical protein